MMSLMVEGFHRRRFIPKAFGVFLEHILDLLDLSFPRGLMEPDIGDILLQNVELIQGIIAPSTSGK